MSEQGNDERGQDRRPVLSDRQGHPVYDNQNNRTVGDRGPTVLENYQFLEEGERNLTQAEADKIGNFNHATQDLYEAIERGEFPE